MRAPSDKHCIHGGIFLLANQMQTLGDRVTGNITSKQWFALLAVSQMAGQPSITDVAKDIGGSRQNTAKLLEQLEQKGYVELLPDAHDHRSRCVQLTGSAKVHMADISREGALFIERLFRGAAEEDVRATIRLFNQMRENMEQMKQESWGKDEDNQG